MPQLERRPDGVNHINVIRFCSAIAHRSQIELLVNSSDVYEVYIHELLIAWYLLFLFEKRNRLPHDCGIISMFALCNEFF